jgi:hypothetical protein
MRLGRQHGPQAFTIERGERRVVDDHGEVKHAAERLIARADFCQQPGNVLRGTGVRPHHLGLHTAVPQALDEGLRRGCRGAAATAEHEVPRAAFYQPLGDHFSEAAEGTGDEVAAVSFDGERRGQRLAAPRHTPFRERDDDFANVPATGHQPERRVNARRRERTEREGSKRALFDEFGELASISRVSASSPLKTASIATTWNDALRRSGPERDPRVLVDVAFSRSR